MPKLKMLIHVLLVLIILLCLYPIDNSIAGDCDEPGRGEDTPTPIGMQTVTGDHTYTDSWFPKILFDPGNPDEIGQNDALTINIIGGCSPYTWSVSGSGFWFDENHTITSEQSSTTTIDVYADAGACGTATITVTGCDGVPVKGYIRCPDSGYWGNDQYYGHPPDCLVGPWQSHACAPNTVVGHLRLSSIRWCINNCGYCDFYCTELTGTPLDGTNPTCGYSECSVLSKTIQSWECIL